jgi:hypothetical protein
MVTLRAFSNPAEAALAKSLLDDHNILCSLADENAYLYGGAPLAMPVRLLVAEDQAEEADRVLKNPSEDCADFEPDPDKRVEETTATIAGDRLPAQRAATNNPWELLAVAALLLLPGLMLLMQAHELILVAPGRRISRHSITVFSSTTAHVLGASVIAVALLLIVLFFFTRRAITRERAAASLLRKESIDSRAAGTKETQS